MAHRIHTDFQADVVEIEDAAPRFRITSAADHIVVLGGLSTGKGRWRLTATAVRHRRRISLQVLARPAVDGLKGAEVLDHSYRATLHGLPPGEYQLRVTHIVHAPELGLSSEGLFAWETTVEVSRDEAEPRDAAAAGRPGCEA